MARPSWKPLTASRRPSGRISRRSVSSGSDSASQTSDEKDILSLGQELEQLHLRLPVSNSSVDQRSCENSVPDSSVAQLEAALEDLIIDIINRGHSYRLKPNSGTAVTIEDYHICVTCTDDHDRTPDYRTWEWHGHIMVFHEGEGYVPEYVYGSFSEPTEGEDEYEKTCFGVGFGLGQILGEESGRIVVHLR